MLALGSIIVGAIFFGVDMATGRTNHPDLSWPRAGVQTGGFVLTAIVCPGMTMVCIAGAIRVLYLDSNEAESQ